MWWGWGGIVTAQRNVFGDVLAHLLEIAKEPRRRWSRYVSVLIPGHRVEAPYHRLRRNSLINRSYSVCEAISRLCAPGCAPERCLEAHRDDKQTDGL